MKKYISIFLLTTFFIVLGAGNSKAVLQSNGNTPAGYSVDGWMKNIRKMEELGGAMGLEETINSDLTSSSGSNGIDVHMQKNTEYGALVILSASSYGNPNKIESGETTTGNVTGVVMKINGEWVAVGAHVSSFYRSVVKRYKYNYRDQGESYVVEKGDAISETAGWHGSTSSDWFDQTTSGLLRSAGGSIFSYYAKSNWGAIAHHNNAHYSRAVVVVGEGI